MDPSAYYAFQAKARGLDSAEMIAREVVRTGPIYDRIMRSWLPEGRHAAIYEVGCGAGVFLRWVRSKGYVNATGSDASEVQVALARQSGLRVELADSISELQALPEGSVDCIVGLDFYEHLEKESLLDFLHEAFRALAPGGRLILRGPNGDSPVLGRALYNDITHVWALTGVAFEAVLRMAGFSRVEFKDDTLDSIGSYRWLRVPLAWAAQHAYRAIIRLATREHIRCLSSSMYLCARK